MAFIEYGGKTIELDENGFLADPDKWDEKAACAIAEGEGVEELTKDRMEIIKFMRRYYLEFHAFPILRAVCTNVHQPRNCVEKGFIDPMKAWKIAGLPNPEVIATESGDEEHKIFHMLVPD